jgi:hypothetical protein
LDLKLGFMEIHRWIRTKKEVQSLMPADVFAARPIDAKTAQYCVNDVIHLPDLHALYLRRIEGDWLTMAMEDLEQDMLGYDDDVGYYDYDENDDGVMNAADGAFCPEALDSCWDKNS